MVAFKHYFAFIFFEHATSNFYYPAILDLTNCYKTHKKKFYMSKFSTYFWNMQ